MSEPVNYEAMFSGVIGTEYQWLKKICPLAAHMSRLVGDAVASYCKANPGRVQVLELGGGTGVTTVAILSASEHLSVRSVDNEPTMQAQAKNNLLFFQEQGRLTFIENDALAALKVLPTGSLDIVASAYTVHNFLASYRQQVLAEIFRVLKPGGHFINGDRYALDDVAAHTLMVQQELVGYFKVFVAEKRLDLLEQWVIHLFADEAENRIMRESVALRQLAEAGFVAIELSQRAEVNALVTAVKPSADS